MLPKIIKVARNHGYGGNGGHAMVLEIRLTHLT
jgi:hypothetical protein